MQNKTQDLRTPNILAMFAYHFPPENAIGGQRPYRFYKYLVRNGLACAVFTAAPGSGEYCADAVEIPDPFPDKTSLGGWTELTIRRLLLPGEVGLRWSLRASRAAEAKLAQAPASARRAVYSSFPPLGASLAGARLARRLRIPWIADFRDPQGGNPGDSILSDQHRKRNLWLEKKTMQQAAVVVANTDSSADRLRTLYPEHKDKVHLIWNGFDPEERLRPLALPQRSFRMISHVGSLYRGRSARPILESLQRLLKDGRVQNGQIRVKLVGWMEEDSGLTPADRDEAVTKQWLELHNDPIPRAEAQALAASSDGLLLLQPQSALQVPGKLFEYLQIGRPVLAYLAPDSPSERILQQSGVPYRCIYLGEAPEQVDQAVLEYLQLLNGQAYESRWFEEQFNAKHHAEMLQSLIDRAHSAG